MVLPGMGSFPRVRDELADGEKRLNAEHGPANIHLRRSRGGRECGRRRSTEMKSSFIMLLLTCSVLLSACGMIMLQRRRAFEAEFLPTIDQYDKFTDAARVYVEEVRGIARTSFWRLTDLDELGLAYVEAMAEKVDNGELTRKEAIYRMRLMESMILDAYRSRALDAITLWSLWRQQAAYRGMHEPVTCIQSGPLITCR
jgi:hypothetical protein